jgi:hypothetical protein
MTEGVATGMTDTTQQAIGSAVPGVVLICMSAVCPYALFKLLAFVDPGTATGAAMRQGLAANGGISGLLSGKKGGSETGSSAASTTDEHGTSSGEDAAESATGGRFASAMKSALGPLGTGIGMAGSFGAKAAAISTDLNNQSGVGDHNQYPDFTAVGSDQKRNKSSNSNSSSSEDQNTPDGPHPDDDGGSPMPNGPAPKGPTPPSGGPGGSSGGPGGGAGAGGGAAGGAEVAAVAV